MTMYQIHDTYICMRERDFVFIKLHKPFRQG